MSLMNLSYLILKGERVDRVKRYRFLNYSTTMLEFKDDPFRTRPRNGPRAVQRGPRIGP